MPFINRVLSDLCLVVSVEEREYSGNFPRRYATLDLPILSQHLSIKY